MALEEFQEVRVVSTVSERTACDFQTRLPVHQITVHVNQHARSAEFGEVRFELFDNGLGLFGCDQRAGIPASGFWS